MLLRMMFVLLFVAVIAETIVHGAAALAAAALRHRALVAAHVAFSAGVQRAQSTVAQVLAADPAASAYPLPAPVATCILSDGNGCELNVRTTFALASPAPAPSCPPQSCTIVLQGNSAVAEGRAAYAIASVVTAAGGATIASRGGVVAFRTFGVPPYASPVGGADAAVDALIDAGPGDDAGSSSSLITVEYADGATRVPGNVWRPRTESAAVSAPAWDR